MVNKTPVTILLVEDDDVDAKAIKRQLAQENIGHPLIRACDGVEALEMLRGECAGIRIKHPYIVISDINMPRMDGLELVKELRSDYELHDAVVFMLTTSRSDTDIKSAYRSNVAGYMVKEDVGKDFLNLTYLLDSYWKIVELPNVAYH